MEECKKDRCVGRLLWCGGGEEVAVWIEWAVKRSDGYRMCSGSRMDKTTWPC